MENTSSKKVLIFDTETTWFVVNWPLSRQPYIVQIAWICWLITDSTFEKTEEFDKLVKPKIPIPYRTSIVHWIYDEDVKNEDHFGDVFKNIWKYIEEADIIIWHNVDFDKKVLFHELERLEKSDILDDKEYFCTMKSTKELCKMPRANWWYKWPKLNDLHSFLFWKEIINAHNAMADVQATTDCLTELLTRGIIKL